MLLVILFSPAIEALRKVKEIGLYQIQPLTRNNFVVRAKILDDKKAQ
jgi:hypothetical protein